MIAVPYEYLLLLGSDTNKRLVRRQTGQRQGHGLVRSPSLEVSRLLDVVIEDEAAVHLFGQNQVANGHILNLASSEKMPIIRRRRDAGDPRCLTLVDGGGYFSFGSERVDCRGKSALGGNPVVAGGRFNRLCQVGDEGSVGGESVGEGLDEVVRGNLARNTPRTYTDNKSR